MGVLLLLLLLLATVRPPRSSPFPRVLSRVADARPRDLPFRGGVPADARPLDDVSRSGKYSSSEANLKRAHLDVGAVRARPYGGGTG